jgi:hypothetical protein
MIDATQTPTPCSFGTEKAVNDGGAKCCKRDEGAECKYTSGSILKQIFGLVLGSIVGLVMILGCIVTMCANSGQQYSKV